MSGDARITGRINIDPPITWSELADNQWAIGRGGNTYPDAVVKVDNIEENTPDGVFVRRSGVAIVPTGCETNGYDLIDDVTRLARLVATTPDGVARRFTGFLHVVWARGEDTYRVVVRDGQAVKVHPTIVWPDDAGGDAG